MTTELKELLKANGLTQLSFSQWYYERSVPTVVFNKKLYKVMQGKLVAFKILECVYAGKEKGDMGESNSWGQHNRWYAHCLVAGEGRKLFPVSQLEDVFASVEDYNDFVNKKHLCGKVVIGENEGGLSFGDLFYRMFKYKHCDEGVWSRKLVGYQAPKGSLTANKTAVIINLLYVDADGVHVDMDNLCRYDKTRTFPTEQEAIENARVKDIVDFDDEEEKGKEMKDIEIDIHISAKSAEEAMDKVNEKIKEVFITVESDENNR